MLDRSSLHDPVLGRVRAVAGPVCAAHGVDLVDVAWATEGGARTLRVTIERAPKDGCRPDPSSTSGWGVSLEDCADVSRDLSQALDVEDFVPGKYNLEVSSPGLERALLDLADFRRFEGFLARVKLARPAPDGQRLLRGTLEGVSGPAGGESVTVRVDKKAITVPAADVVAANLVYELGASPKGGDKTKKGGPKAQPGKSASGTKTPKKPIPKKAASKNAASKKADASKAAAKAAALKAPKGAES